MTRSALASTFGGIVRPICFAAFRLMMNSNFFGCSTGKSAGLFEQLQAFTGCLHAKVRKPCDVAAGPCKTFDQASLDRVAPNAYHNDGDRFSRILGSPGPLATALQP
jgi:hypothetical protein